jgi:hypothetical protein
VATDGNHKNLVMEILFRKKERKIAVHKRMYDDEYDGDCSQDESELDPHQILSISIMERRELTGRKTFVMEGYLMKRGFWKQCWKKRFFVLEDSGRLSYFKSESDKAHPERARGCVPISLDVSIEQRKSKDGKISIIVNTNESSRFFSTVKLTAPSQGEHSLWMAGLEKVQNNVFYIATREF